MDVPWFNPGFALPVLERPIIATMAATAVVDLVKNFFKGTVLHKNSLDGLQWRLQ